LIALAWWLLALAHCLLAPTCPFLALRTCLLASEDL